MFFYVYCVRVYDLKREGGELFKGDFRKIFKLK